MLDLSKGCGPWLRPANLMYTRNFGDCTGEFWYYWLNNDGSLEVMVTECNGFPFKARSLSHYVSIADPSLYSSLHNLPDITSSLYAAGSSGNNSGMEFWCNHLRTYEPGIRHLNTPENFTYYFSGYNLD